MCRCAHGHVDITARSFADTGGARSPSSSPYSASVPVPPSTSSTQDTVDREDRDQRNRGGDASDLGGSIAASGVIRARCSVLEARLPTKSANWSHRVAEGGEVATRGPALNLSRRRRPDASEESSRTRHSDDFKTDPCRCSSHDKGFLASRRVADQGSVGKPEAVTLINGPHDPTRSDCRHQRQLDRHDDGHTGGQRSIRWRYPKPGAVMHAPAPQSRPGGLEQHRRLATDIDAVAVNSEPADASRTEIPRDARLQIGQRQPSSAFSFSRQGGIIDDSQHQTHSCTVRATHQQAKRSRSGANVDRGYAGIRCRRSGRAERDRSRARSTTAHACVGEDVRTAGGVRRFRYRRGVRS